MKEHEFGADILTLLDEDGVEHEFEVADTMDLDGVEYMALIPVLSPEEALEDSGELIVLKVVMEDGEEFLEPIMDELEFNRIADIFMNRLEGEYDFIDEDEIPS